MAEIAPPAGRGHFVTTFNVAIGLGIVTATVVGATMHHTSWRWMIAAASVPAAIFFGCALRLPESPRWLVREGKSDAARDTLGRCAKKMRTSTTRSARWRRTPRRRKSAGERLVGVDP